MKIIILLLLSSLCLSAADAPAPKPAPKEPLFKVQEDYYHAGQFALDLYGTAAIKNEQRDPNNVRLGAGLGATYFVTRGLGIGLRAESENTGHSTVDLLMARGTLRVPISSTIAPYGFLQGGFRFERDDWEAGAGGGLEIKFHPNAGVFGEAGLQVDEKGNGRMIGAAGIRLSF